MSILPWRAGPPDSDRVSRVRPYLGTNLTASSFRVRGYHPVSLFFPEDLVKVPQPLWLALQPQRINSLVWALPASLAATKGISFDFFSTAYWDVSLQRVSLHKPMYSVYDTEILLSVGCPIRTFPGQSLYPTHRNFSQVSASFIAFRCQGIHQQPLLT